MRLRFANTLAIVSLLLTGSTTAMGEAIIQNADRADRPYFVEGSIFPSGRTSVFGVAQTQVTDVVLLNSGLDEGFRLGMVCRVQRGDLSVADLILVDVRADRAAALILKLEPDQAIRSGDAVSIKTINL
ncbi:MAG: hypothetical protein AAGA45_06990 [Verrucomicrobiota bacterium]